ncbi:TctC protein [Alicycliphilus sp. B1]|nr:TctC protein [Alicycliphilus sp. B1]
MQRRTFIHHTLAASAALLGGSQAMPAMAQAPWPTGKAITYVVPFPPGGNTDTLARVIAQPLSQALGTPVVIDNKGGAGGSIGSALAARAPADGYTILGGTISSHAINVSLYAKPGLRSRQVLLARRHAGLRPAGAGGAGGQPLQDAGPTCWPRARPRPRRAGCPRPRRARAHRRTWRWSCWPTSRA